MPIRFHIVGLLLLSVLATGTAFGQASLAVIVHPDNPDQEVEYSELRRILRMDRQYWPTGEPIRLMLPGPSSEERARVLERGFQMSEQAFRQHWISVAYRLQALSLPRPFNDCSVAVRVVSSLNTALAIVDAACVKGREVKVLKVDGKRPGERGYRL